LISCIIEKKEDGHPLMLEGLVENQSDIEQENKIINSDPVDLTR